MQAILDHHASGSSAVSFVIQNLNNVLNKDSSDLRVICSVSTREFDVGFYGPFVILLR